MQDLPDLRGMEPEEYEKFLAGLDEQPYRARQLFRWVQREAESEFDRMTDLPAGLRQKLTRSARLQELPVLRERHSSDGRTSKYLLGLADGQAVECVRLSYTNRESRDRFTACVSTQVGCGMGCAFCATGLGGFQRNLSPGEIVGQVLAVEKRLRSAGVSSGLTNVVFMGMGEPLANYTSTVKALRILHSPGGLNLSYRRLTVSTCGLVPRIRRLAGEGLPVVLAVSLHAASDSLRDQLVPINRRYPLAKLLEACRFYIEVTGRRITFQYALIAGLNDGREHAAVLARLLKGMLANVNLIPLNPVPERGWQKPSRRRLEEFRQALEGAGLEAVVREEMGAGIEAACGQLRGEAGL